MDQYRNSTRWKAWLRANRIIPLLTITIAGVAGILNIIGILQLAPVDGIIIALLALLAVDGLTERLSVLEKIESRLGSQLAGEQLRNRARLVSAHDLAQKASEIAFIGVSGISLLVNDLGFFEQKLRAGCKLRFILLDPSSSSLQTWNLLMKVTTTERDINTALELLKGLMQTEKAKGKCEVRLSKVYPPYAILISDPNKDTGLMNVEFYTYKTTLSDRPHIQLARTQNQYWFDFFRAQFEQMWADSEKWSPVN